MKNTYKQPSLWLLILLVGFPQISETIYTPSLPQLTEVLQTSDTLMQQTLSIYFVGFALGVLLWGILSDVIGRRAAIVLGILVYIIGSIGCLYLGSITSLLFSRFIQAIGAATGSVVTQTIIRDLYDDKSRPVVLAKISTALAFSPALGPLIGGTLAHLCGVTAVFTFLIILGISIEVTTFFKLPETFEPNLVKEKNIGVVLKRMIRDRNVWVLGALIGIINGTLFSYYAEAPFLFFNFTEATYGCIGLLIGIGTFAGARYSKKPASSDSYIVIINKGLFIMTAGGVLFIITMLLSGAGALTVLITLASIFIIMFGLAVTLPHCLSHALVNCKNCLGIAGAMLSLYYYTIVGGLTYVMSMVHNGTTLILPVFLTGLSILMFLLSKLLK